jgi:hypothetical protein
MAGQPARSLRTANPVPPICGIIALEATDLETTAGLIQPSMRCCLDIVMIPFRNYALFW